MRCDVEDGSGDARLLPLQWFRYLGRVAAIEHITMTVPEALQRYRTQRGVTLAELSAQAPLLLIFLRHFG